MDIAALIISILALAVSVIVAIIENYRDIKINRINLESDIYKDIYKEHLIKCIPKARMYIGFTQDGNLRDTEELREELNKLRQDSLYFLYNNKSYYNGLKKRTQNLEDYLLECEEENFDEEHKRIVLKEIQNQISDLYKYITNSYLGEE